MAREKNDGAVRFSRCGHPGCGGLSEESEGGQTRSRKEDTATDK